MAERPFSPGSISLGLSAVGESGRAVVARLVADARAAVDAGFDGVTLSEHHAGFPHYVPSPVLLSGVLLGALSHGWACASPGILPLRTPVTVAEDLAWLAAAYPGRVGAGFVPGYQEGDFSAVGVDFAARQSTFWTTLAEVARAVRPGSGEPSPIKDDPAVRDLAGAPIPLLAGVGGAVGARRAARLGAGLLITALRPPEEAAALVATYRKGGGTADVVLIRRVHVGSGAGGFAGSMVDWAGRSDSPAWLAPDDSALLQGSADEVAEGLVAAVRASGCTALNVRIDAYANDPDQVAGQIDMLGTAVLPVVRAALGWPTG